MANVIKLRNLRGGGVYLGLSGGAQCNHKSPTKGTDGSRRAGVREGDMTMLAELGHNANTGRKGHKTENVGSP